MADFKGKRDGKGGIVGGQVLKLFRQTAGHAPSSPNSTTLRIQVDIPKDVLWGELRFKEVIQRAVYGCPRLRKEIAADLGMTESGLSRRLADNPDDNLHFPVELLPELICATGDLSPIFWLCNSFLAGEDENEKAVLAKKLDRLLPDLERFVAILKAEREDAE